MQIDKKTLRGLFVAGVGCIVLYWVLHEPDRFRMVWSSVTNVMSPFVIGAALAFILNVPMRAIERHLKAISNPGVRRVSAIMLTLLCLGLVIIGIVGLLVPQIVDTVQLLVPKLVDFFLGLEQRFYAFLEDNPDLLNWVYANTGFHTLDWSGLIQNLATMLKNSLQVIATGAFSAVGNVTGTLVDILIGIVFALYCLTRKEILARQGRRLIYAFLPEYICDGIVRVMRLTNSTFSNFISGQGLEACILGALFAVSMAIFGLPYIPLVSVLIAVTALVPVVGAFVGCFFGTFFILVNDPVQALVFVAMFLILQQLENNLIYPRVVGTSIGLPGMWVLLAVTVGGEIMGVGGMLLMIPLVSVLYSLLREITNKRISERNIDPEKLMDHPPELKSKFKENRERKQQERLMKQMKELAERAEKAAVNKFRKKDE